MCVFCKPAGVWPLGRLHGRQAGSRQAGWLGAPPTSLCSPPRCCRGLRSSTPPLHSATAAAAACLAGAENSPQQRTVSCVFNLSVVEYLKTDGYRHLWESREHLHLCSLF